MLFIGSPGNRSTPHVIPTLSLRERVFRLAGTGEGLGTATPNRTRPDDIGRSAFSAVAVRQLTDPHRRRTGNRRDAPCHHVETPRWGVSRLPMRRSAGTSLRPRVRHPRPRLTRCSCEGVNYPEPDAKLTERGSEIKVSTSVPHPPRASRATCRAFETLGAPSNSVAREKIPPIWRLVTNHAGLGHIRKGP